MTIDRIKARRDYMTKGTPSIGGFPAVPSERVRVLGYETIPAYKHYPAETWLRVRDESGNRFLVHPSRIECEA